MDLLTPLFFLFSLHLAPVAVVSAANFPVGQEWRWNYTDSVGNPYSYEQYTVIENDNGVILIEMASHFPGETVFKAHHRIQVPLEDCLRAYLNASAGSPWLMRMFFLDSGVWKETEPPSTLAFEEKFNCNPYQYDSREYLTVFRSSPRGEVFAQKRWRKIEGSWFMNSGELAGVMFEKEFPHNAGGETYHVTFDSSSQTQHNHFVSF
jgi:hypothetical protein